MNPPFPEGADARDTLVELSDVLHAMAREDPRPLLDVLQSEDIPADPQRCALVSALASGKKSMVVPALVRELKHRDLFVRWSAATSLIALRSKRSIAPLIEAITDRSPTVSFAVVEAINTIDLFRDQRAIPRLRALTGRKNLERQHPGLWKHATQALKRLEEEAIGRDVSHVSYSGTGFSDRDLARLPDMPGLRSMDLSETEVSDRGLQHLARFRRLEVLSLSNSRTTTQGMELLRPLVHLQSLDIGGPGYGAGAGLVHLARLPRLRELRLGGCVVGDDELHELRHFPALEYLELMFHTGDEGLEAVSAAVSLEELRLYRVPATEAGLVHLARLPKLRRLWVEACPQLTDNAVTAVSGISTLDLLVLRGTNMTPRGLDAVRAALPQCEVDA